MVAPGLIGSAPALPSFRHSVRSPRMNSIILKELRHHGPFTLLGAAFGLLGVFVGIPESVMFAGFLIISVAYYGMFTRVWKALTFLSRSINRRAMAKIDRRVSDDRRQGSEIYYVDGIPKERRSGMERRRNGNDRRNGEDEAGATIVELEQSQHESLPDDQDQAARIGAESAAGNRILYN